MAKNKLLFQVVRTKEKGNAHNLTLDILEWLVLSFRDEPHEGNGG